MQTLYPVKGEGSTGNGGVVAPPAPGPITPGPSKPQPEPGEEPETQPVGNSPIERLYRITKPEEFKPGGVGSVEVFT